MCPAEICKHFAGVGKIQDGEAIAGLLRRTMYLASRHKDRKVTAAAGTAFAYLLRSSVNNQGTAGSCVSLLCSYSEAQYTNRTALTAQAGPSTLLRLLVLH